ncbi:MAG: tetratricopeptide repeat protein, partial [Verrucomicrobiota bacterium]
LEQLNQSYKTELTKEVKEAETFLSLSVNFFRYEAWSNAVQAGTIAAEPDTEVKTNALMALALAEEKDGRLDKAAATWQSLARATPKSPLPRYQAVRCFVEAGNTEGGLKYFEKFAVKKPKNRDANHLLGMIYLKAQRYSRSWRHLARAALHREALPESKIMLAQVTMLTGDIEEALGWFRKAINTTSSAEQRERFFAMEIFSTLNQFPDFKALRAASLIGPEE